MERPRITGVIKVNQLIDIEKYKGIIKGGKRYE